MLDLTQFRESIESEIDDNYSATPVKFENVELDLEDAENWVAVFDKPAFSQSTGMGEKSYWLGGELIIQIFTPLGSGTKGARTIGQELSDLLSSVTIEGISMDTPMLIPAPKNEHWYQMNLHIPYVAVMGQNTYNC